MVVVERHREADRIAVEGLRSIAAGWGQDYIEAVRQFNTEIRTFPGSSGQLLHSIQSQTHLQRQTWCR